MARHRPGPTAGFISYDEAIERQSVSRQGEIEERLTAIATGRTPIRTIDAARLRQLIDATQSEHQVRADIWDEFFDLIQQQTDSQLVEDLMVWAWRNVRQGRMAQFETPLVHAVGKGDLTRRILRQRSQTVGMIYTLNDAGQLADDLGDSAKWRSGIATAVRLGLQISDRTIWATFSKGRYVPYAGLAHAARDVACALGLDDRPFGGVSYGSDLPLMLLQYTPASVDPRFPTMVEAWGSRPPNYYYTSAPRGALHGWTKPWPNDLRIRPWPEVVHGPTPLGDLTWKARMTL